MSYGGGGQKIAQKVSRIILTKNVFGEIHPRFLIFWIPWGMPDCRMSGWKQDELCAVPVAALNALEESVLDVDESGLLLKQLFSADLNWHN